MPKIKLYDCATKAYVSAELVDNPDPELMLRAEERWRGWMDGVEAIDKSLGLKLRTLPFTYGHWEWGHKATLAQKAPYVDTFLVLSSSGEVEGMMLAWTSSLKEPCRLPHQAGAAAVYVDLVATAPWNLPGVLPMPRYRLAGDALMARAVTLSREHGYKGRVGLHALDGAASWYAKLGMASLGRDSNKQNLEWFEFDEVTAGAFLPP